MSLASGVIPASRFVYGSLSDDGGFHATTGFQKNFRFFYKNKFLPPSGVRFVANQQLRLLKSNKIQGLCKGRDGFYHVAASFRAASSLDDNVGDFKDCGRVKGVKEARNGDGSDTSTGNICSYGHGNGDNRGKHRGGGDNGGTGSGGLGESADWEAVRWFCWQIFKAWKHYKDLAKLRSLVVGGVGNIQAKIDGRLEKMVEPNYDGLDRLLLAVFELLLLPFVLIAVAICAALFAGILLFCCLVAALIWFWRPRQP